MRNCVVSNKLVSSDDKSDVQSEDEEESCAECELRARNACGTTWCAMYVRVCVRACK